MKLALDSANDQVILGALRAGELRRAATLLLEAFGQRAYRLCRLAAHDAQIAEELTYRGFSRAFAKLDALRGEQTPGRWLLAHVREVCRQALLPNVATEAVELREPEADIQQSASMELADAVVVSVAALRAALAQLDAAQRATLALCCGSTDLVPVGRSRALSALRERLGSDVDLQVSDAVLRRGLAELRWPLSDELRRRLSMLCTAL